jgi:hypothetical protein
MNKPNWIARTSDGEIFYLRDNGKYSMEDSGFPSYEYDIWHLTEPSFRYVWEEKDLEFWKERKKFYSDYIQWFTRSDGHGGKKGGTEEEKQILFNLKAKNYKILQGEKYMCQTNVGNGEIWNFKWNLDKKYNLFEYDY